MTTRIPGLEMGQADALASAIDEAGFDVAVIEEESEDGHEVVVYTPATPEELGSILDDHQGYETY